MAAANTTSSNTHEDDSLEGMFRVDVGILSPFFGGDVWLFLFDLLVWRVLSFSLFLLEILEEVSADSVGGEIFFAPLFRRGEGVFAAIVVFVGEVDPDLGAPTDCFGFPPRRRSSFRSEKYWLSSLSDSASGDDGTSNLT